MNHLATPLFWSALQVTALTLCGLVLSALATRRAAIGAFLTTLALLACCILTALAFCPLPDWWGWWTVEAPSFVLRVDSPAPELGAIADPVAAQSANDVVAPSANLFGEIRQWAAAALLMPAAPRTGGWVSVVVWLFAAGMTLAFARLGLGLWAVHRLVRRCRPVADGSLLDLAALLCKELDVGRSVGVLESDELTTAATVGWRRPVVLLPADWPAWDMTERRAVLAHELAHIRRGDFLTWLLARVSLALHFYHPLLYWLARRLHLHQELAADALGARASGGHGPYLRVLARMALRQEARLVAGPAQTFLSSPGTLLRRIHMLRVKDDVRTDLTPRGARSLGWMTLALAALAVSTLRSPAQKQEPQSETSEAKTPLPEKVESTPFDLTYLTPEAQGVMAFRPAAVFSRPDMKEYRDLVNAELKAMFAAIAKGADPIDLRIEDIEQIVASVRFATNKNAKPGTGQTSMLTDVPVIHTVRDIDWKKTLFALVPNLKEVKMEGRTCYVAPKGTLPIFGPSVCFCVPDPRTLVVFPDSEETLPKRLRNLTAKRTPPAWLDDWKHVEHAMFAESIGDIRSVMAERQSEPADSEPGMLLMRTCKSIVAGFDVTDELRCRCFARTNTDQDAEKMLSAIRKLLRDGHEKLKTEKQKAESSAQKGTQRVLDDVLTKYELKRDGTRIKWQAASKVGSMAEFLNALMSSGMLGL